MTFTTPIAVKTVQITSPASLLAIVPHLLGFQPSDSLVIIGTVPPRGQVQLTLRYDLPDPPGSGVAAEIARYTAQVLSAQHIETAVVIGYGPGPLVTPVIDALREHAAETGLKITELLRVQDQRYWSYLCEDPACCPPEGTPYNMNDPVAAALATDGAPVYASRAELAATLTPVTGPDADLMREATRRAEKRASRLLGRTGGRGRPAAARRRFVTAGVEAVKEAVACYRGGDRIPAGDAAAWLAIVLQFIQVRDDAWCRMDPEHRKEHLRLWTDITRLAQPGYVAAPASLLAFTAWQAGHGALANVALDRALNDDPQYRMAELLRQAVDAGAPPSLAKIPMTPEEVAASYEAGSGEDNGDADEPGSGADDGKDDGEATQQ